MKKSNSLVSCIIPTKNRPQSVIRAIDSVFQQSYANIEILVIDDSNNGETQQALASLGNRIKYIKNELNLGASHSRNIGIRKAEGDVIAFLDDDDIWLPDKIVLQLDYLKKYPIVGCNYIEIAEGRKRYKKKPPIIGYQDMLYHNYLGSCSFLMFDAAIINGCYFDETLKAGQDWDIILSVMKKKGVEHAAVVPRYLVEYDNNPTTRITTTIQSKPEIDALYEKYHADFDVLTEKLFFLYNKLPANGDPLIWFFRENLKAKLKKKSFVFLLANFIKLLFSVSEDF